MSWVSESGSSTTSPSEAAWQGVGAAPEPLVQLDGLQQAGTDTEAVRRIERARESVLRGVRIRSP